MRLETISVLTASKAFNKARVTGKLSLEASARLNLLNYYIKFARGQANDNVEGYNEIYTELVRRFDSLVLKCPDIVCDIEGDNYGFDDYESSSVLINPYKPKAPSTDPTEPTPTDNEPATIGDYSMTVADGVTTTLTMTMFNSSYTDPESDLIDAIRVDDIHTTNAGTFYYDGIPITVGQIIFREDIDLGKLTHTATSSEAITSDSFEFSVRDEGSGIWVN